MTNYREIKINEVSIDQHEPLAGGPNPLCIMHVVLPNGETGWIAGRDGIDDNALDDWLKNHGKPAESRQAALSQHAAS